SIQEAATQRDLIALEKLFDQTEADLVALRASRDSNIPWLQNYEFSRFYYSDSEHFIEAGFHMLDAGREAIVLMKPFADAGGFKVEEDQVVEETGLAEAFATWVGIMPEIAADSDKVLEKLALAGGELAQVDASRYPEEFQGVTIRSNIETAQTTLVQLNDAAPDIKEALTIIPPLLGVDTGEKRYMILFQNDKELRPTGGFWTYVSTFKLNNGLLSSDFTSNGTYNVDFTLDAIDSYYTFPKVPAAYENHLKVERMFARDANISPDLPTSVDQFMVFWDLAIPLNSDFKPVDGVFTIDTKVLEELLEITGPVTLNGITYTPETVTLELEKIASLALKEQANRKRILGDLMEEMLINVFESERNIWPTIVEKGFDLAKRKHVQAYLYDEAGQQLLEKYNYGGRLVDTPDQDYAMVVSTNLGGGNTNGWFVNKEVEHELTKENGRWLRTTTVRFNYGEKDSSYDPFIQIYQDWVRLYVPQGSELVSLEGSQDEPGTAEEGNKTYFHGYITLNQGETKELVFKYYLPEDLAFGDTYSLYLQKQSGINKENHYVTVNGNRTLVELSTDETYITNL
ncbi:DUF4012 domain-containing protein, partial [Candidatus Dojkabacteria bacterium]|nr:DUF4012 domain-containing protein [Candidatus Dojkabacteria bacterium]